MVEPRGLSRLRSGSTSELSPDKALSRSRIRQGGILMPEARLHRQLVEPSGLSRLPSGSTKMASLRGRAGALGSRTEVLILRAPLNGGASTLMGGSGAGPTCSKRWLMARAVLVGRPILWGLAVGREAGVKSVLEMLRQEFDLAVALSGCPKAQRHNERSCPSLVGLRLFRGRCKRGLRVWVRFLPPASRRARTEESEGFGFFRDASRAI
jgi:hypothetical protein